MKILICGGAGYVGSHMARLLERNSHSTVCYDNLSTGHRAAVRSSQFVEADLSDQETLESTFGQHGPFDAVMHFAARSLVTESVSNPAAYYENNVIGTLRLLEAMRRTGHHRIVFSSTAAVYGIPQQLPIDERHPCSPISPYGATKLMIEQALRHYGSAYGLRSASLRYFNAAGAAPDGTLGENHEPETHLIPRILRSILDGREPLQVFGDSYGTADGSCVRDYVHVDDICRAHLSAVAFLEEHAGPHVFNLGNGEGFSVFEIIAAAERVTGQPIRYEVAAPRSGDPPVLIADATKASRLLGWQPRHAGIDSIIESAWRYYAENAAEIR